MNLSSWYILPRREENVVSLPPPPHPFFWGTPYYHIIEKRSATKRLIHPSFLARSRLDKRQYLAGKQSGGSHCLSAIVAFSHREHACVHKQLCRGNNLLAIIIHSRRDTNVDHSREIRFLMAREKKNTLAPHRLMRKTEDAIDDVMKLLLTTIGSGCVVEWLEGKGKWKSHVESEDRLCASDLLFQQRLLR